MKKRILSLLLALVLVIGLMPVTAQAGELDNGLQYNIYGNYVMITDYTGSDTDVVIPAEIEGLPVIEIRMYAFYNSPDLASISIPDSVTKIGESAFRDCSSLTSISIPDGVTEIDYHVFDGCSSLTSISIPDSITEIGEGAFQCCSSLTSISIPDSVTEIGLHAFHGCSSLTGIHVNEHNPNYSSDDRGVLFDKSKTTLIQAPGAIADSYTIPNCVNEIGYRAFIACSGLTSISIPNSVTKIGEFAFMGCSTLSSISIPDSVAEINHGAFMDCSALTNISIPDSITKIDTYTFSGCSSLTNIVIPDSVTFIGDGAFSGCSSLTGISIPDNVTEISAWTFDDCSSLTSISIPARVTKISAWTFKGCSSLTSIYFEGDAPQFDDYVFYNVIATAYYPSNNPTWTEDVMQGYDGEITWVPYNPDNPFTDVPTGSFYEAPVLWALENGITTGASETSFNPNGQCLRAQVVTFLWRAAGQPEPTSTINPFEDVKESDFYYKAVLWAVENGITNGADAAHFNPLGICNRAQVVTFLHRAFGSPAVENAANPFTDVESGSWYASPVLWAVENGITNGLSADSFGPDIPCNRAQVVTFLHRAYT